MIYRLIFLAINLHFLRGFPRVPRCERNLQGSGLKPKRVMGHVGAKRDPPSPNLPLLCGFLTINPYG
jgi:hypothetical protein